MAVVVMVLIELVDVDGCSGDFSSGDGGNYGGDW